MHRRSHYASDYQGVVIEIEFPTGVLKNVDYASGNRIQRWAHDSDLYKLACDILTTKHSDWECEQELRLLSRTTFHPLPLGSIKSVILGSRILPSFEDEIRAVAGDVPVRRLGVRSGELKAD